ncbi:hypothetical protein QAD02_015117 [Eretmocerus hayati]|uniref:Uncharacterized protein n=1 Tax=Eretmocerus hayati TaxID=131215 RepID=A0ACC2P6W5_9HYME|nr:hypothetical protein QAD02_015117 [Eretmocerus hayati]
MKLSIVFCCLVLAIVAVKCSPLPEQKATDDLSPLNEVTVFQNDDDDERGDRDKRKIGVIKLGITNGILNFVFGKLDAFLDAKTKSLVILDESNKAKNAAFDIDPNQSATGEFITKVLGQKAKAASNSIGPLVNAGSTFLSTAKQGIAGAFISKFAPLSSLSSGLAGGLSGGSNSGAGGEDGNGDGGNGGGSGGSNSGSFLSGLIGSLSSGSGGLSGGLSGGSSGGQGASASDNDDDNGVAFELDPIPDSDFPTATTSDSKSSTGFANLGVANGKKKRATTARTTTTTEDIVIFNRDKVSLDIPSQGISEGFTLITNISRIVGSVIKNSAHRTEQVLEVFKPLFRGIFAIKGLPSDNPK